MHLSECDRYSISTPFINRRYIYEYDITSAGTNIALANGLIDNETYDKLMKMSKESRVKYIGNLSKDKTFSSSLSDGFKSARKVFLDSNSLSESNIVEIRKDAIYTFEICECTEFDNIKWMLKNVYMFYMRFPNSICVYIGKEVIEPKGLGESKSYFDEFNNILKYYTENYSYKKNAEWWRSVCTRYKYRKYPLEAYRQYMSNGQIELNEHGEIVIEYNWLNIFTPLTLNLIGPRQ